MQGLYLQPEAWYEQRRITAWLNTRARSVDVAARQVLLATGDRLDYDRLILANGSAAAVPAIDGFGRPGTFVIRDAEDAIAVRAFAQQHDAREAVVAGGGPLGLEVAYSLHQLGLAVTVLERSDRLLHRQVDVTCSMLLAGIRPSVELARAAGIDVGLGVVVDDRMRTSAPDVYAAGDVAEFEGRVPGLWPIAVDQDLTIAGRVLGDPDDEVISFPGPARYMYCRLVVRAARLIGGLVLDRAGDAQALIAAVRDQLPVEEQLDAPFGPATSRA